MPSLAVGSEWPHSRLSCKHQRHWFCESQQNLTLEHYRFSFSTSSLAEYGDCGLLRLHLLVLSHVLPCELYACSSFRTISRLSLQSRTHFCFIMLNINSLKHWYYWKLKYVLIPMNDEVYVWPFMPFEHDPIVAVLPSCYRQTLLKALLSFDLR